MSRYNNAFSGSDLIAALAAANQTVPAEILLSPEKSYRISHGFDRTPLWSGWFLQIWSNNPEEDMPLLDAATAKYLGDTQIARDDLAMFFVALGYDAGTMIALDLPY